MKEVSKIGLDNGIYIKSHKRELTREDLPTIIKYPFEQDYGNGIEVCYSRKWWGVRTQLISEIKWDAIDDDYYFFIERPEEVIHMIEIIISWFDEDRWESEGDSIWTYDEAKYNLRNWIINLSIIYGYMLENPDIYLVYYDSY